MPDTAVDTSDLRLPHLLDGLTVSHFPTLGRAAVATRDFSIGDPVLIEDPLFVVPKDPQPTALHAKVEKAVKPVIEDVAEKGLSASVWANEVVAWFHLSGEKKGVVKENFATPTMENHFIVEHTRQIAGAVQALEEFQEFDVGELHHMLLVLVTNASEFVERYNIGVQSFIGLYEVGSKLAHSCSPSTILLGDDKQLVHVAIRPIKKGDIVTSSYILHDDVRSCWPTKNRRKKLWDTKFFLCRCERCEAPDSNRTMKCPTCKESTAVPRYVPSPDAPDEFTTQWTCTACEATFTDADMPLRVEEKLEEASIEATAIFDRQLDKHFMSGLAKMDIIHKTALSTLGSEHWITQWPKPFLALRDSFNVIKKTPNDWAMEFLLWTEKHIMPAYPHIHARNLVSNAGYCMRTRLHAELLGIIERCRPWLKIEFIGNSTKLKMLKEFEAEYGVKTQQPGVEKGDGVNEWLPSNLQETAKKAAGGGPRKGKKKGKK